MVFPVVMYGCESWTIKKAECQRIDAFQLWWLEKTLESPLECKEIQQVHPKGVHWKDWCWSWNSNTFATWCEQLTHLKWPWCWERLRAEGEGDDRGWDGWMASLSQWTWVWVNSGSWWWSLFQWVNSSHEVAKVLEFQLQHQSFQWTPRTDLF